MNDQQKKPKIVFVTVGTTLFDDLIEEISSPPFLSLLLEGDFTQLIVQYGKGKAPLFAPSSQTKGSYKDPDIKGKSLDWEIYKFKPSLHADINSADLIISHAGAGSIMEGLASCHDRNKNLDINERNGSLKKLIVVINEELMDNHQIELAEALASRNYLMMMNNPMELQDKEAFSRIVNFVPRDFKGGNLSRFGSLLNSFMGFKD